MYFFQKASTAFYRALSEVECALGGVGAAVAFAAVVDAPFVLVLG
jgi:hypothetical protein